MKLRVGRELVKWDILLKNHQRRICTANSKGYTLLEVMLFMAISAVFFAISVVVMQGQGARTEFVASMNDVNSKMQQWIDQVRNGYTSSSASASAAVGNYNCSLDGSNNPLLSFPGVLVNGNAVGTNLNCIFLGKALMVNDGLRSGPKDLNDKIYAYTVLGRRTYNNGSGQVNVDNLLNANPTAAVFDGNGDSDPTNDTSDINLTEVYKIPNGTRVRKVWSSDLASNTSGLAGFFIDPTSANNSLLAVQYPLTVNTDPTAWSTSAWDIPKCINLNLVSADCKRAGTPANLWPMTQWNICFESTRDDEKAWLKVISSNGVGAVTKLEMGKGGLC
jgi:hypothetical protein